MVDGKGEEKGDREGTRCTGKEYMVAKCMVVTENGRQGMN